MAAFHYKASTSAGEILEGERRADDEASVVEWLHSQGYIPIRIEEGTAGGRGRSRRSAGKRLFGRKKTVRQNEVAVLTGELATLLRAGLPLDRAFSILMEIADDGPVRQLLSQLQEQVRGGSSLAEAMETQAETFSPLYISMIRAGEAGGALDVILGRLADFMERSKALKNAVTSALIYPAILVGVAGLSVIILLTFVVPQFQQLFEDAGKALPVATQIVIAAGNLLQNYWWALLLGFLAILLFMRHQLQIPERRYRWDGWLLRLPLVGDLIAKLEVARLSRTLNSLLLNGVPLLSALAIIKNTLNNQVMAEALSEVADALRQGHGMADPLLETALFPKMAVQMIKVGEETGQLEDMLGQVAEAYDLEVESTIKRLLALLEPVLILTLGVVIAGIIMSILVAILSVNELAF
ncbi:General secretion pathway protein F [Nitrosococcus oceani ATCC 19707]|uniref:General secretion pathway protein F n=2 Tax=Nitrosococcus oceani TaxID=1229 RepID=Q3J756_NITOC|nr:type II secretion system F family protein [Nitrosococcus oceani]ABA59340.1 General secretion pathway protein F [Nitrosococcus oceani ATCC 19707]EDZ66101.1 Bacterial type II secretion system protein F domain [Nitrosococcus oceani AFC27]KFI18226.1 general secretion pathway protein GspF [Nitrosococcus oceani C-27]GEM20091.1 general secretion pathway protein GspF [Nitrosococcus oceani]